MPCSRRCCSPCSSRPKLLSRLEAEGDITARLAILEELKTLPCGAVWDHYCLTQEVPAGPRLAGGRQGVRARRALETRLSQTLGRGNRVLSTLLELTQISKAFAGVQALKRVSFDLRAGEVHALVGENGAGKSTLIKVITGAHVPDEGTIEIQVELVADLDPLAVAKAGNRGDLSAAGAVSGSDGRRKHRHRARRRRSLAAHSLEEAAARGRALCSSASARRSTRDRSAQALDARAATGRDRAGPRGRGADPDHG